jgi:hypothetical protein
MKKKQLIRLTEGDLHRVIKESVNKILLENDFSNDNKLDLFFKKWEELTEFGVTYLNKKDKEYVIDRIKNDKYLMQYFERGEFGKIIREINDDVAEMQWRRYVRQHEGEWQRKLDLMRDTLY